jgi:hypothetical protein
MRRRLPRKQSQPVAHDVAQQQIRRAHICRFPSGQPARPPARSSQRSVRPTRSAVIREVRAKNGLQSTTLSGHPQRTRAARLIRRRLLWNLRPPAAHDGAQPQIRRAHIDRFPVGEPAGLPVRLSAHFLAPCEPVAVSRDPPALRARRIRKGRQPWSTHSDGAPSCAEDPWGGRGRGPNSVGAPPCGSDKG